MDTEEYRRRLLHLLQSNVSQTPVSSRMRTMHRKRELIAREAAERETPRTPFTDREHELMSLSRLAMLLNTKGPEHVITPGSHVTLKSPAIEMRSPAYTAIYREKLPGSQAGDSRPWTRASRAPSRLPTRGSQGSTLSSSSLSPARLTPSPPFLTPYFRIGASAVRLSPAPSTHATPQASLSHSTPTSLRAPSRENTSTTQTRSVPTTARQTSLAHLTLPAGLRGLSVNSDVLFPSYRYWQREEAEGVTDGDEEETQEEWTDTRYVQSPGNHQQSAFEFVNKLYENQRKSSRRSTQLDSS